MWEGQSSVCEKVSAAGWAIIAAVRDDNKVTGSGKRDRVWEHPAFCSSLPSVANAVSLSD